VDQRLKEELNVYLKIKKGTKNNDEIKNLSQTYRKGILKFNFNLII